MSATTPYPDYVRQYREYLRSAEWAKKRAAAQRHAGKRCQVCNSDEKIEVHHRTYENLFREKPRDLTVLCAACHGKFHDRIPKLTEADLQWAAYRKQRDQENEDRRAFHEAKRCR